MYTLWDARNATVHEKNKTPLTANEIVKKTIKLTQTRANFLFNQAKERKQLPAFEMKWLTTGIAEFQKRALKIKLPPPPAAPLAPRKNRTDIFTDGGAETIPGTKPPVRRAGHGLCEYTTAEAEPNERTIREIKGPVVTDSKHPHWLGADRQTNNTGELSALILAIAIAHHKPTGSYTLIHSDSTYALTVANCPQKYKEKQSSRSHGTKKAQTSTSKTRI